MTDTGRQAIRAVPVTEDRLDDLGDLFRGTDAATCWAMVQRTTAADERERVADWKQSGMTVRVGRRACFAALASDIRAPGLMAYLGGRPVGWISLGPRADYARVALSRATPPVDDANVWIIPCLLVRREDRGQGVTGALIEAAAQYAAAHGADALEAYPRPDNDRPSARCSGRGGFVATTSFGRRKVIAGGAYLAPTAGGVDARPTSMAAGTASSHWRTRPACDRRSVPCVAPFLLPPLRLYLPPHAGEEIDA